MAQSFSFDQTLITSNKKIANSEWDGWDTNYSRHNDIWYIFYWSQLNEIVKHKLFYKIFNDQRRYSSYNWFKKKSTHVCISGTTFSVVFLSHTVLFTRKSFSHSELG